MNLIINLQDLQQQNGTLLMTKIMENMAEEMKMIQLSNLKQKSLNQIFVINQIIYSCEWRYKSYRCYCKY